jgi:hypothetical protein
MLLPPAAFDPPQRFAAYLNTLRWNCVTSTDPNLLQSPFRAGNDAQGPFIFFEVTSGCDATVKDFVGDWRFLDAAGNPLGPKSRSRRS